MQADAVISQAVAAHGRVDGVANCVGSIVLKSAHTTSDADFDQVRPEAQRHSTAAQYSTAQLIGHKRSASWQTRQQNRRDHRHVCCWQDTTHRVRVVRVEGAS